MKKDLMRNISIKTVALSTTLALSMFFILYIFINLALLALIPGIEPFKDRVRIFEMGKIEAVGDFKDSFLLSTGDESGIFYYRYCLKSIYGNQICTLCDFQRDYAAHLNVLIKEVKELKDRGYLKETWREYERPWWSMLKHDNRLLKVDFEIPVGTHKHFLLLKTK